jgi:putative ABC transport system permease protein
VLMVVAAVHVRALVAVKAKPLGYDTGHVVALTVHRWRPGGRQIVVARTDEELAAMRRRVAEQFQQARAFDHRILDDIRRMPGVDSASIAWTLPLRAPGSPSVFVDPGGAQTEAHRAVVSEDYFRTMGMAVRDGRTFDARDWTGTAKTAVVSEALANQLWPSGTAIGRRIAPTSAFYGPSGTATYTPRGEGYEVIGVVADAAPVLAAPDPIAQLYLLADQAGPNETLSYEIFLVRSRTDFGAATPAIKAAIEAGDPDAHVIAIRTLDGIADEILYPRRAATQLLGLAAVAGLLLAAMGLYGVVAYSVAQRRREMGIRATLGASRRDLIVIMLVDGVRIVVIGTLAGVGLAVVIVRLTASLMPGLPLVDMLAFCGVPVVLATAIAAACYLPARRAADVDPVEVLRAT